MWRSRWAAFGAAVAISFGAGGLFVARAAPGPAESTIVNVAPERILDTRDPNNVGLAGPFVSPVAQKLQVTGPIPTATGTKTVVPAGATGVQLNVTAVSSTANGFVSIRPGDATGAPTTSSLNFTAGEVSPNAVQVALPASGANAGQIDITYDALGTPGPTTDLLIDVVGYTTDTGLQQLIADTTPMFATINAEGVVNGAASRLVSVDRLSTGTYDLTFDRSLVGCTAVGSDVNFTIVTDVSTEVGFGGADKVRVVIRNRFGSLDDTIFSVIVQCPPGGPSALVGGPPSISANE